jgi:hypothetical protein
MALYDPSLQADTNPAAPHSLFGRWALPHVNLGYLRFLSAEIVFINGQFSLIYQPLLDDNEAIVDGRILSSALLPAKQSQECPKCSSMLFFIGY